MMKPFQFASTPRLQFGVGRLPSLVPTLKNFGTEVLLVTGARSFTSSSAGISFSEQLKAHGLNAKHYSVAQEPTPHIIDAAVKRHGDPAPDVVVAIGGGSVLDAGKAISAMLPLGEGVKDYLEGVGTKPSHPGKKIPFVAVPTTAGTGSEATKNAVISETGTHGYKRSLRHDNFVPDIALIDPTLSISCSPSITASSGMDAFTQLLESYLSTNANPLTDAYAVEGLRLVAQSLLRAYRNGEDIGARSDMALAAYLSGVTLANAGLGLVHGFASSVGGFFDIPHGVICSALMAPANLITVRKLRAEKNNPEALMKYAHAGKIFVTKSGQNDDYYIDALLDLIKHLTIEMKIPTLGQFGVSHDFNRIVAITDNKNNPVGLVKDEIGEVLALSV